MEPFDLSRDEADALLVKMAPALRIPAKTGGLVPVDFNRMQREILANRSNRKIVLTGRQGG